MKITQGSAVFGRVGKRLRPSFLVTVLTQLFFPQGEKKLLLLIVMCGMAGQARQLLVSGILSHEVLMTLSAARPHNFDARFPKAKNLARIAIAVYVRRSRPVARFASLLPRMLVLEQSKVRGIGDGSVDVVVARLAGI